MCMACVKREEARGRRKCISAKLRKGKLKENGERKKNVKKKYQHVGKGRGKSGICEDKDEKGRW